MRVLGIDPGSRITGYGLVDRKGTRLTHVASGAIEAFKANKAFDARMEIIFRELCQVIETHKPDAAVLEGIFHYKNAQSALKLGHARGVAMLACRIHGVEIAEYQPTRVKQCVVGNGHANKEQVRKMVCLLLGIKAPPKLDESDALANAIAHINAVPALRRLKQAS